ncbi:hypothetical protein IV203_009164 [Nitzschia inconspicua]|uniref:Uncharacterized protein n=1 Tax=Nitzschia inconspicua TaxID=303405 RepID=A0A9K3L1M2_9STRA|nr:hypothetical protein IV203_009164 [Nitzschia inconspicua]
MAEDLFTPYIQQLPPGVAGNYDEDEVLALNGSLEDIIAKGWTFHDFCTFSKDSLIFWTPDASIVSYLDVPSHHNYTVDMIFPPTSSSKKKTLHIAAVNSEATAPVLTSLLAFFIASHMDEQEMEIIFKAFATNPRKDFGGLDFSASSLLAKTLCASSCRISLSFQFMTLSPSQCQAIFSSLGLYSIEFRQCTTGEGLRESLRNCKPAFGPKKLKISCTQQEFATIAEGLRDNSSLTELELQLHFIFNDDDMQRITAALQCQEMENLVLEYLDMDDDGWSLLCKALGEHSKIRTVTLAFTDKFADAARRLTPERRRTRSEAILNLIQTSPTIQELNWPEFQQDESLGPVVQKQLEEKRGRN